MPILPRERDPRLIAVRRGGSLSDADHRLLASWALECAAHVLPHFAAESPSDPRPSQALEVGYAWIEGRARMRDAHNAAFAANAAGRGLGDAARFAALSAGQAVAVSHVAAHDLGAAAYAIRSAMAAAAKGGQESARLAELEWQRGCIPEQVRDLVLEDQAARRAICWHVFDPPGR